MKNLTLNELYSLKGKNVKFSYISHDNRNVKESIIVKDVVYNESEMDGKITFDTPKGEACIGIYQYNRNGNILAGDDGDELEYQLV